MLVIIVRIIEVCQPKRYHTAPCVIMRKTSISRAIIVMMGGAAKSEIR